MPMEEKWSVDKLDGANWLTWKFQMRHLLLAKGLWGFVDGTEELTEDASASAREEFKKKEQRAFSTIALAVCTSQLYLITSCEKPKTYGTLFVIILSATHWQISSFLKNNTSEMK